MAATKQFTLRLPPELYEKSRRLARRHRVSLNELARRGLERLAAQEAMSELEAAYDLAGGLADANVEHFAAAQREVLFDEDDERERR